MRILQMNSGNFGSTGNIMLGIADMARKKGHTCYTACPDGRSTRKKQCADHIFIGNRVFRNVHIQLGSITGFHDVFSVADTFRFLKKLDEMKPDLIHFHNLHDCYINVPMLMRYVKKHQLPVIWTLHDCWAFTGHCPYFDMVRCEKWKEGCSQCPQLQSYPSSMVDQTKNMWRMKKKWFSGIGNMTIVTPSAWLGKLVKESYLKEYPVEVIHNGIDLNVFSPVKSAFRAKHRIPESKKILLGVAFGWEPRKGLDVFLHLEKQLDREQYQIVLVGTDDEVDKLIPDSILSIHRTQNQQELAEIYSAADLFINPTREENYPTVNMEAIACGTPVLTFRTGGSPEIPDDTCGAVVSCDDLDAMVEKIHWIFREAPFSAEACLARAVSFDRNDRFMEYVALYENMIGK